MRILVAEDDALIHTMVGRVLRRDGHEVIAARDGLEALALFDRERPDIVLTDYVMPGMDGLALIAAIRARSATRHVPIVMFTGGAESDLLRRSLEAGAIEFLTKPFQPDELRCRVAAIAEMARMHADLAAQKAQDDEEVAAVKFVLGRLLEPGQNSLPACFSMETLQTERINGDACAYRQGLPDIHFGLVCDATGHGLMAGISTIPVVEAFLAMVTRDIPLENIYREVNRKLRNMLPTGRFACMCLFRLDTVTGSLSVLNAGMPDALLLRTNGELRTFPSVNKPAGIIISDRPIVVHETQVAVGDRFLAVTDGLEELFPRQELVRDLLEASEGRDPAAHVAAFREKIVTAVVDREQHDDVSWALWEVPPPALGQDPGHALCLLPGAQLETGNTLSLDLNPERLALRDFLPSLLTFLSLSGVCQRELQTLALLLSEALLNAVDHGLMGLDSALKLEGFEAWEAERRARQDRLKGQTLRLEVELLHEPLPKTRLAKVRVTVTDSGPGFDWRAALAKAGPGSGVPSGRGLTLINSLAQNLVFNDAGNRVSFEVACQ